MFKKAARELIHGAIFIGGIWQHHHGVSNENLFPQVLKVLNPLATWGWLFASHQTPFP